MATTHMTGLTHTDAAGRAFEFHPDGGSTLRLTPPAGAADAPLTRTLERYRTRALPDRDGDAVTDAAAAAFRARGAGEPGVMWVRPRGEWWEVEATFETRG